MNLTEINGLLAMVNEYDKRMQVTDVTPRAWLAALAPDMTLEHASAQVVKHYGRESRSLTISDLNASWREVKRADKFFPGLPAFTAGSVERSRWLCMQGILEGVEELNACRSRDGWAAQVLARRREFGAGERLDARRVFSRLDWGWFDENRGRFEG